MNKRMILYIQGAILLIEAAIMVLPIAAALIYREPSGIWFFYTALAAAIRSTVLVPRSTSSTAHSTAPPSAAASRMRLRDRVSTM